VTEPAIPNSTVLNFAAVAGLFAIPLFINAVVMILHGAFFTRYGPRKR